MQALAEHFPCWAGALANSGKFWLLNTRRGARAGLGPQWVTPTRRLQSHTSWPRCVLPGSGGALPRDLLCRLALSWALSVGTAGKSLQNCTRKRLPFLVLGCCFYCLQGSACKTPRGIHLCGPRGQLWPEPSANAPAIGPALRMSCGGFRDRKASSRTAGSRPALLSSLPPATPLQACLRQRPPDWFATLQLRFHSSQGTWEAPSVKRLTLDFGSGHDLTVHELESHVGLCADSVEPAWDSLSPSLRPSPVLVLWLSQTKEINNLKKKTHSSPDRTLTDTCL